MAPATAPRAQALREGLGQLAQSRKQPAALGFGWDHRSPFEKHDTLFRGWTVLWYHKDKKRLRRYNASYE